MRSYSTPGFTMQRFFLARFSSKSLRLPSFSLVHAWVPALCSDWLVGETSRVRKSREEKTQHCKPGLRGMLYWRLDRRNWNGGKPTQLISWRVVQISSLRKLSALPHFQKCEVNFAPPNFLDISANIVQLTKIAFNGASCKYAAGIAECFESAVNGLLLRDFCYYR